MTFLEVISALILKPLQLFYEIIFMTIYEVNSNPGLTIIILSLIMNFLLLPLYKRADAIQLEERNMEQKLHVGVAHIKKTFRGDERMMILQTYYRQNHYKPTYVLKGAVSLGLEIPFFIAAYGFLSNLYLIKEVSFGPIADLGSPDGMLQIAGMTINILPILMTVINIISSLLYTKGSPIKAKMQLYIMAIIFFVVLYNSPSGLVLYWTINNFFVLVKTLIEKTGKPVQVFSVGSAIVAIVILLYGVFVCPLSAIKLKLFYVLLGLLFFIPLLFWKISKRKSVRMIEKINNNSLFYAAIFTLVILTGLLIPSAVLKTSPQEFMGSGSFYNPLWYILSAFCLAAGTFFIWGSVFFTLSKKKGKTIISFILVLVSFYAIADYMFFGKNHGLLKPNLQYDVEFDVTWKEQLVNLIVLTLITILIAFLLKNFQKFVQQFLIVAGIVFICMSSLNIYQIVQSVQKVKPDMTAVFNEKPSFKLSKNEKNVVVIMLDRAYNGYIPFFLNEKPELKEMYDGFTYYSNTISYGGHTNFGAPALFGGYEYTPLNLNKRTDELLPMKHNEALKVMPAIFSENGYDVTLMDLPDISYNTIPDYSIFDDIPNVKGYVGEGAFSNGSHKENAIRNNQRNFFCYSLLKIIPVIAQETLYQNGTYRQCKISEEDFTGQYCLNNYVAEGIQPGFMNPYMVLNALPLITEIVNDTTSQFIMVDNNTAHNQALLQEPEYIPLENVDNTVYELQNSDRFTVDGKTLPMENTLQYSMYQSNMAALLQLGKWFDFLRKNDVYDNTRIIIVADHGFSLGLLDELVYEDFEDCNWYYPLLMVKDFNSKGFHESKEFMTNADTPTLATKDVIDHPVNPYTGNEINSNVKYEGPQYVIGSREWETDKNNGYKYLQSVWYSIHDNLWKRQNWEKFEEEELMEKLGDTESIE